MSQFHFLRPDWFWLLLPLAALLYWIWSRQLHSRSWQSICDPKLLPYLLVGRSQRRRNWPLHLILLALLIAIIALAGPTWERMPQPLFRQHSALVLLLDLSASMNATDLKPNRLVRARLKVADILRQRREGQTALVVFAGDAFIVTPLTDDSKTILSLLDSLDPELMPVPGSHPSLAIEMGQRLLQQAGLAEGDLMLVTDDDQPETATDAAEILKQSGYRLSVLGVGTMDGAPIPIPSGGFLKDAAGQVVLPRLDPETLKQLAEAGGGRYQTIRVDDQDWQELLSETLGPRLGSEQQQSDQLGDRWREAGAWLLWPLTLLTACAFRRGWLTVVILCFFLNQPVQAFDWQQLWQRSDQRGAQAFNAEDYETAARQFRDRRWQASSLYRSGQYSEAAEILESPETSDDWYNRGNALAKSGRLPEALDAYKEALKLNPQDQDALTNKQLVEEALKQQKQSQPQSSPQDDKTSQQSEPSTEQTGQQEQSTESSGEDQDAPSQQQNEQEQGTTPSESAEQQPQQEKSPEEPSEQTTGRESDREQPQDQNSTGLNELTSSESQRASEQWLQRIPDDPGGLLRRKFLYQYRQRGKRKTSDKTW